MPRRPSPIGQSIYDEVEKLRADNPGMTRQAAFEALGSRSEGERSVATIAANYYRMARNINGSKKPARKRTRTRARRSVAVVQAQKNGMVESIDLDKLETELTEMTAHAVAVIRATKERLAQVEAMKQQLDTAREALSR